MPAEYRSIVRCAESIRGVRAWVKSPWVHKNKLSRAPDVPENFVNQLTRGARPAPELGTAPQKVEASQYGSGVEFRLFISLGCVIENLL